jgi:hypothetical protein
MNNILKSLTTDNQEPTEDEMLVYKKLINSLLEQAAAYKNNASLHPKLKSNLQNFTPSLNKMQSYIQSKI